MDHFIGPARPATGEQQMFLLAYMENHPAFCQREFTTAEGHVDYNRQWERLATLLNEIPRGSRKSVLQWRKVRINDLAIAFALH